MGIDPQKIFRWKVPFCKIYLRADWCGTSQGPQPLLWYTIQLGNLTSVEQEHEVTSIPM